MRIALHITVEVDVDAWVAEFGVPRKEVRAAVRRWVDGALAAAPVPLLPVVKPSPTPSPAPAPVVSPAAGPERAPDSRPAADPAGTTTPKRAATPPRSVGVRDAQPAGATAPREQVSAARPTDGTTPAPAPAARAGHTAAAPRHVAGLVLRPAAPGPDPVRAGPGRVAGRPRRRLAAAVLALAVALVLAVAAWSVPTTEPATVTPLPAPPAEVSS